MTPAATLTQGLHATLTDWARHLAIPAETREAGEAICRDPDRLMNDLVTNRMGQTARNLEFPGVNGPQTLFRMRINIGPGNWVYLAGKQQQYLFPSLVALRRGFYYFLYRTVSDSWPALPTWLSVAPPELAEQAAQHQAQLQRGWPAAASAQYQLWDNQAKSVLRFLSARQTKVLTFMLSDGRAVIEEVILDGANITVTDAPPPGRPGATTSRRPRARAGAQRPDQG